VFGNQKDTYTGKENITQQFFLQLLFGCDVGDLFDESGIGGAAAASLYFILPVWCTARILCWIVTV
jgi:hypothetical protein